MTYAEFLKYIEQDPNSKAAAAYGGPGPMGVPIQPAPKPKPAAAQKINKGPRAPKATTIMGGVKQRPSSTAIRPSDPAFVSPAKFPNVTPSPSVMQPTATGTLAALRNFGKATLPMVAFGAAADSAVNAGNTFGNQIGDYLAGKILPPEAFQRSGRQATPAPVATQPAGVQSVEPAAFIPPEFTEEQEGQQITAESFSPIVRFEMPATPPAEEQPVEILGDPDTIVQEDPNDLFAQQLRAIAEMPPHTLEREQVNQADEQTIAAASKNRVERPAPPKETFGRKLKRFIVAGSGPADFTRLDRQESDLYQAQNRLTEPEQFGANVAAGNVRDSKQFNRAATMAEYGTGGIHPATKFALDLLTGERRNFLEGQREATARRETHANQLDLIGKSAAMSKQSPEFVKMQALWNMAEKNPDGFASFIEKQTGYQLPPEFIASMMESRKRGNDDVAKMSLMLDWAAKMSGRGGTSKPALNTSSIPKKD